MSDNLREQLDLALEAQQATSEVLSAISRSPHDLQPILEMIVETSVRLCRSTFGHVRLLRDDGAYHTGRVDRAQRLASGPRFCDCVGGWYHLVTDFAGVG